MHVVPLTEQTQVQLYIMHEPELRKSTVTTHLVANNQIVNSACKVAVASPLDQWCRKIGRHIAMGRALKAIGLTKEQRRRVMRNFS